MKSEKRGTIFIMDLKNNNNDIMMIENKTCKNNKKKSNIHRELTAKKTG